MRAFDGRVSIVLTLMLAGVLAVKMIDSQTAPMARPEAAKPAIEAAIKAAAKPTPQARPQTVVMPAPPVPRAAPVAAPEPKPTVTAMKPTPQIAPPPAAQPAIKPLKVAKVKPVVAPPVVAPKVEARAIKPLRPRLVAPDKPVEVNAAPVLLAQVESAQVEPAPPQPVKHPGTKAAATGRVLLRVLEHGKGPAIEIAWPESGAERAVLADHMRQCYGMRLALMDRAGALYTDTSHRGSPWTPNLDLYSGFVRRTSGRLPGGERALVADIRRRHGQVGATVHVFPRRVDALLLGGLQSLIGRRYHAAQSIRAHYSLHQSALTVGRLSVDGRNVEGRINLTAARHCRGTST